jgi:hypothetical protein
MNGWWMNEWMDDEWMNEPHYQENQHENSLTINWGFAYVWGKLPHYVNKCMKNDEKED